MKIEASFRLKAAPVAVMAESMSEYVQRLKKMGIKPLDEGVDEEGDARAGGMSHVFEHPTDPRIAVKVFIYDPGSVRYIKFCKAHKSNPYCLKVYQHTHDPRGLDFERSLFDTRPDTRVPGARGQTDFNAVFIERLRHMTKAEVEKFTRYLEGLAGVTKPAPNFGWYKESAKFWTALATQKRDRNLSQFATWFVRQTFNGACLEDIHTDNVMMRGNQPVFSDPMYGGG